MRCVPDPVSVLIQSESLEFTTRMIILVVHMGLDHSGVPDRVIVSTDLDPRDLPTLRIARKVE